MYGCTVGVTVTVHGASAFAKAGQAEAAGNMGERLVLEPRACIVGRLDL